MKVYIVTAGIYSDYHIERVFTDYDKAKEFSKWNEMYLEEYDTDDNIEINKGYEFNVCVKIDKNNDISISQGIFEKTTEFYKDSTYLYDYSTINLGYELSITRYLKNDKINPEEYLDRLKKSAYDIAYVVKYNLSLGHSADQINELLKGVSYE